jgi:hypothetical protein
MKKWIGFLSFVLLAWSLTGCYYDREDKVYPNGAACDTSLASYNNKVKPILQSNCYGCHSGGSPVAGFALETYAQVKVVADNGKLVGAVTHAAGFSAMPKGLPKLSDCDIALITKWVNLGAPEN